MLDHFKDHFEITCLDDMHGYAFLVGAGDMTLNMCVLFLLTFPQ